MSLPGWDDTGQSILNKAIRENTPPSKPSGKFGIGADTSFNANSQRGKATGFPPRTTSKTNQQKSTGVKIIPGKSLSTHQEIFPNNSGTKNFPNCSIYPKRQAVFERLVPSSDKVQQKVQAPSLSPLPLLSPVVHNQIRGKISSNLLVESGVHNNAAPGRPIRGKSQDEPIGPIRTYGTQPQRSNPIRTRNGNSIRSSSNTTTISKRPSNEVIDLVDEDEDNDIIGGTGPKPCSSPNASLDADIFKRYGDIPGVTVEEKRLAFGSPQDRIPVERVYLGVYGFCADATASVRRLYVRVDSGVNKCILLGLNQRSPSVGQLQQEDVRLEEIPFDLIKNVFCGPISKEKYGHDAVVFLSIQAKITLRSVATGQNCMLSPTTQTTTSQSAKYIMLLMNFQNMKILYNHLINVPAACLKNNVVILVEHWNGANPNLSEHMIPHLCTRHQDLNVLSKEWSERAKRELDAVDRGKRRKQRQARLNGEGVVNPTDSLPYTIYPVEPEIMDAITIFNGDLRCLDPGEYLNDNLVDLKIKHIIRTQLTDQQQARVHAFSCMFYSRLTSEKAVERGHAVVSRWTKNVDIFDKDILLVPINYTYHWSLAIIIHPGAILSSLEDLQSSDLAALLKSSPPLQKKKTTKSATSSVPANEEEEREEGVEVAADATGANGSVEKDDMNNCKSGEVVDGDVEVVSRPSLSSPIVIESSIEQTLSGDTAHTPDTPLPDSPLPSKHSGSEPHSNQTVILHCDSLGMHGTNSIGNKLKSYLRLEWEARKMEALNKALESHVNKINIEQQEELKNKHGCVEGEDNGVARELELSFELLEKQLTQRRKRVFNDIPIIKCKVPMQQNGFDCGLFVTKFAEMVLKNQFTSTAADIKNKFAKQILATFTFNQLDVDNERYALKDLLETIKRDRENLLAKIKAENPSTDADAIATVGASAARATQVESAEIGAADADASAHAAAVVGTGVPPASPHTSPTSSIRSSSSSSSSSDSDSSSDSEEVSKVVTAAAAVAAEDTLSDFDRLIGDYDKNVLQKPIAHPPDKSKNTLLTSTENTSNISTDEVGMTQQQVEEQDCKPATPPVENPVVQNSREIFESLSQGALQLQQRDPGNPGKRHRDSDQEDCSSSQQKRKKKIKQKKTEGRVKDPILLSGRTLTQQQPQLQQDKLRLADLGLSKNINNFIALFPTAIGTSVASAPVAGILAPTLSAAIAAMPTEVNIEANKMEVEDRGEEEDVGESVPAEVLEYHYQQAGLNHSHSSTSESRSGSAKKEKEKAPASGGKVRYGSAAYEAGISNDH